MDLDAQALIAMLGGVRQIAATYQLSSDSDLNTVQVAFRAAMSAACTDAPLLVLRDAILDLQRYLRTLPTSEDFRIIGEALVRVPEPGGDRICTQVGEYIGQEANQMLDRAIDPMTAMLALVRGIDPFGDYDDTRLCRGARLSSVRT